MSIVEQVFRWLQYTTFATAFRESAMVYPAVLIGHLTGMGLFGGMIAITDMRLLGLAMKRSSITDVVDQLRVWKRIGDTPDHLYDCVSQAVVSGCMAGIYRKET